MATFIFEKAAFLLPKLSWVMFSFLRIHSSVKKLPLPIVIIPSILSAKQFGLIFVTNSSPNNKQTTTATKYDWYALFFLFFLYCFLYIFIYNVKVKSYINFFIFVKLDLDFFLKLKEKKTKYSLSLSLSLTQHKKINTKIRKKYKYHKQCNSK